MHHLLSKQHINKKVRFLNERIKIPNLNKKIKNISQSKRYSSTNVNTSSQKRRLGDHIPTLSEFMKSQSVQTDIGKFSLLFNSIL